MENYEGQNDSTATNIDWDALFNVHHAQIPSQNPPDEPQLPNAHTCEWRPDVDAPATHPTASMGPAAPTTIFETSNMFFGGSFGSEMGNLLPPGL